MTTTLGSVLSGNATDGDKTIFYTDVIGLQYKASGATIGYVQFETASGQMNNEKSAFFAENTFTYQEGKNGVTEAAVAEMVEYILKRLEIIKYGNVSSELTQEMNDASEYVMNIIDELPEI